MKKLLLSLSLLAFFIISCGDDDTNKPSDNSKKNYWPDNIGAIIYTGIKYEDEESNVTATYLDSAVNEGNFELMGKTAKRIKIYTDMGIDGEFDSESEQNYAVEDGKLYLDSEAALNSFNNDEFDFKSLLDITRQWILIADDNANKEWTALEENISANISGFPINGKFTVKSKKNGQKSFNLESTGESMNADSYLVTLEFIGEGIEASLKLEQEYLVVDGKGIMMQHTKPAALNVQFAGELFSVEGDRSTAIRIYSGVTAE